jgi:hypothetical protein
MNPEDFLPGDDGPTPTPTPAPTEPVDPEAPVLPELDSLLAVGPGARAGVYWPADATAGPGVIEQLGDLRTDDQSSLTVISSATTTAGASGATVAAHGRAGGADLLVYDRDISQALQRAAGFDETSLRGAALAEASAYLSFATAETGGAPLLVTLGRDPERSRVALATTISSVTDAPNVTPVTLGGLSNSVASDVELVDAPAEGPRVDAASALFAMESELSRFATILDDPRLLTGPERAEILQLLGVAWMPEPTAWTGAVAEHRAATRTTLDSVGLLPTTPIDLYGSNAGLRFWVRNDLPYPVNLVLYATPDDLRLDVQRANPLVAQADSNTRVDVPVQARVGSGDVTLALQLRSRASVAIGAPGSVDVSVRAEWETVGIAALAVVVGALLLLGVVRTALKLRARRSGTSDESESGDDT